MEVEIFGHTALHVYQALLSPVWITELQNKALRTWGGQVTRRNPDLWRKIKAIKINLIIQQGLLLLSHFVSTYKCWCTTQWAPTLNIYGHNLKWPLKYSTQDEKGLGIICTRMNSNRWPHCLSTEMFALGTQVICGCKCMGSFG